MAKLINNLTSTKTECLSQGKNHDFESSLCLEDSYNTVFLSSFGLVPH